MTFLLQACADKLKNEMKDFGYPPKFPEETPDDAAAAKVRWSLNHCVLSYGLQFTGSLIRYILIKIFL